MFNHSTWKKALRIGPAIVLASTLAACGGSSEEAVEQNPLEGNAQIGFFSNPDNSGATQQVVDRCNASSNGAYTINYELLPSASDAQHQQLAQRLAARDSAIDIMAMDVNWTAEFAAANWVKEISGDNEETVRDGTLEGPLDSASYNDKLYGAPFNSNTQLLWYRSDLVPTPPATWDEMIRMANDLAAAGKPHLIEIQGAKYEGLTVWFNSLVNSAGGSILDEDGEGATNNKQALTTAATIMKNLATSQGADPSLPNQQEDQNRLAFEQGTAAFQLNYPFVYPSAQKNVPQIAQNMKWAPWPSVVAGTPAKVTLGGINLGVSNYSRNQEKAMQAVNCLRSAENQKILATVGGLPPTLAALYDDPAVREAYPFAEEIRAGINNGSVRPQTPLYSDVSLAIQNTLSPPANIDPAVAADRLTTAIDNALQGQGLQ